MISGAVRRPRKFLHLVPPSGLISLQFKSDLDLQNAQNQRDIDPKIPKFSPPGGPISTSKNVAKQGGVSG